MEIQLELDEAIVDLFDGTCPLLDLGLVDLVEQLALAELVLRIGGLQVFAGLLDAASTRSGKGYDGLAREVVSLNKGVDDGRGSVPPDGEAHIDHVVLAQIDLASVFEGGTRALVLHLEGGTRFLVTPVEIGIGVKFLRGNFIKVGTDDACQLLGGSTGLIFILFWF